MELMASLASSWTVSGDSSFHGQPSDGIGFRHLILWTTDASLFTVSDWVVRMGFDCFLVACMPTSLSHCFYRVRDNAFSHFLSIVDYYVSFVH